MSTIGSVRDRRPAASGPGPGGAEDWVQRFGPTERFAHWWTVAMISVALLSGLTLGDDGSGPAFPAHVGAVIALGVGLLAALLVGDHRALFGAARALFVPDRRDRAWLAAIARHPGRRSPQPAWGMFNTGQKALTWAVTGALAGVIITGIQAWSASGEGGLHGAFVVVLGVLLGAHVFMALVNPPTRHALNAMLRGRVRRSWAAVHHADWVTHAKPVRR